MRFLIQFSLLIGLFLSQSLFAASVWQVSKGEKTFYLAGTVHLLSESDFPLPKAYDTAFNASSKLLFETDLGAMTQPQGMMQLMSQNTFAPGQSLQQVLSAEVYAKLKSEADKRQWPLTSLEQFKPAFASMTMSVLELQRLGAAGTGVDMHYWQLGQQQNKTLAGLETLDEHLAVLNAMNQLDANLVISSTLNDLDKLEAMLGEMKAAWIKGDVAQLEVLFLKDLQQYPELEAILLTERNHAWMKTLTALEENNVMVLVGALHLAGKDGLLKLLADQGYQLTQLTE